MAKCAFWKKQRAALSAGAACTWAKRLADNASAQGLKQQVEAAQQQIPDAQAAYGVLVQQQVQLAHKQQQVLTYQEQAMASQPAHSGDSEAESAMPCGPTQ